MTQEDMPNIREIMDKSFDAGYKDAMDFAIKFLLRELVVAQDEFGSDRIMTNYGTKEEFIEDFRNDMIKELCRETSK